MSTCFLFLVVFSKLLFFRSGREMNWGWLGCCEVDKRGIGVMKRDRGVWSISSWMSVYIACLYFFFSHSQIVL